MDAVLANDAPRWVVGNDMATACWWQEDHVLTGAGRPQPKRREASGDQWGARNRGPSCARQRTTVADGPDLSIKTLALARIESPLAAVLDARQTTEHYVDEDDRVIPDDTLSMVRAGGGLGRCLAQLRALRLATQDYFDPSKTRAGIVTCGGLCPGINDVIRSLVRNLMNHSVSSASATATKIFIASCRHEAVDLTPPADRRGDGPNRMG